MAEITHVAEPVKYEGPTISEHPYILIEIKNHDNITDVAMNIVTDGIFNANDGGELQDILREALFTLAQQI